MRYSLLACNINCSVPSHPVIYGQGLVLLVSSQDVATVAVFSALLFTIKSVEQSEECKSSIIDASGQQHLLRSVPSLVLLSSENLSPVAFCPRP